MEYKGKPLKYTSTKHGRRLIVPTAVCCTLFAALLLIYMAYGREPLLMMRATPVLNQDEMIRNAFRPGFVLPSDLMQTIGKEDVLYRKVLATLRTLHYPAPDTFQMFYAQASPDAKWLLLYHFTDNAGNGFGGPDQRDTPLAHKVVALSVDGTQRFTYTKTSADSRVLWRHDSLGWVEVTPTKARFYPLQRGGIPSALPVTIVSSEGDVKAHGLHLQQEGGGSGNTLIVPCDFNDRKYKLEHRIYWCLMEVSASSVILRPISVPLPPEHREETREEILMASPDGRRVAFTSRGRRSSPLRDWLGQYLPFLQPIHSDKRDSILWVCNSDGTDLREIGIVPDSVASIYTKFWSKNGRALFFTYQIKSNGRPKNTDWSVDVE